MWARGLWTEGKRTVKGTYVGTTGHALLGSLGTWTRVYQRPGVRGVLEGTRAQCDQTGGKGGAQGLGTRRSGLWPGSGTRYLRAAHCSPLWAYKNASEGKTVPS